MPPAPVFAATGDQPADDVRRSVRLFRSFLTEQRDPDGFYNLIADDTVALMKRHLDFAGRVVADFGGGPGFYAGAFEREGARCVVIDASASEMQLHGRRPRVALQGLVEQVPLRDGAVDVAFSSNLLEHVRDLPAACDEIVRVVKPGGFVVLSYTIWWGPWGGHETSPWHYLGGARAGRRYARKHGKAPKHTFGEDMFAATVSEGLDWIASRPDLDVLELRPRYLPPSARHLLRIPGLREVVTWNLWMVLRRNDLTTPSVAP